VVVPDTTIGSYRRGSDARLPRRTRNDPEQYEDLADEWWLPDGRFAALHWLAQARARLIPEPPSAGAPLLDVACGGGLLAAHLTGSLAGWRHVGVDTSLSALVSARRHGVAGVRGDAMRLPFADASLRCVVAGEVLEHLTDLPAACAELARVLAPGGTLVVDTLADTLFCRIAMVRLAERLPGGPPARIHDPALFVDPRRLRDLLAAHGVELTLVRGLRPSARQYVRWLAHRHRQRGRRAEAVGAPAGAGTVTMVPTRSTAAVYQAVGVKGVVPAVRA
jgi:2-polyprenyl-6-hydroxyphenyl methylase/3-demethylubiquinone-9 3-methyltransferase